MQDELISILVIAVMFLLLIILAGGIEQASYRYIPMRKLNQRLSLFEKRRRKCTRQ